MLRQLGYEIRRIASSIPAAQPVPEPVAVLPTPREPEPEPQPEPVGVVAAPAPCEPEPESRPQPQPLPPPPPDAFSEQQRLLGASAPAVIFDVGAHHGETARTYRTLFPNATIHSFEPYRASFEALEGTAAELTGMRAHNVALDERAGEAVLNSNAFPPTNSLLPTAPTAESVWPGGLVDTVSQVRVKTTTLDEFCRTNSIDVIDLLKIDVQGAEPRVLRGGEGLLRAGRVRMVYTEIITLPTYDGQAQLDEFLSMMRGYGFELFNFFNLSATAAGQLRQVDAIFLSTRSPLYAALSSGSGTTGPELDRSGSRYSRK
jgi:FkbM family methyltransferase